MVSSACSMVKQVYIPSSRCFDLRRGGPRPGWRSSWGSGQKGGPHKMIFGRSAVYIIKEGFIVMVLKITGGLINLTFRSVCSDRLQLNVHGTSANLPWVILLPCKASNLIKTGLFIEIYVSLPPPPRPPVPPPPSPRPPVSLSPTPIPQLSRSTD